MESAARRAASMNAATLAVDWHPGDRVRVWVEGPVTAVPEDQPPDGGTAR